MSGVHYLGSMGSTGDDTLSQTNGSLYSDRAATLQRYNKGYRGICV